MESILPNPATVSPRATFETPLGPSKTMEVPTTSRIVQPGMVVGGVSNVGAGLDLGKIFV
jgi:hypothetical protein